MPSIGLLIVAIHPLFLMKRLNSYIALVMVCWQGILSRFKPIEEQEPALKLLRIATQNQEQFPKSTD
jgi:hypothetical protein